MQQRTNPILPLTPACLCLYCSMLLPAKGSFKQPGRRGLGENGQVPHTYSQQTSQGKKKKKNLED